MSRHDVVRCERSDFIPWCRCRGYEPIDLCVACLPLITSLGELLVLSVAASEVLSQADSAFSVLRVYAVCDKNKALAMVVGLLSLSPIIVNAVGSSRFRDTADANISLTCSAQSAYHHT